MTFARHLPSYKVHCCDFLDGASKHALQAFCDSLRNENAKNNIDVVVVSPSYVKTNIALSTVSGKGEKYGRKLHRENSVFFIPDSEALLDLLCHIAGVNYCGIRDRVRNF